MPRFLLFAMMAIFLLGTFISSHAAELRWQQATEAGHYVVQFQPQTGTITIGQFENWVITLKDKTGKAVYPAHIGLSGGMPEHGHGMPSQPQVTKYLGDGRFLVEGMKFNMAGEWLFGFVVETPTARDRLKLTIEVDY
jgi:hypothetical protein